MIQQLIATARLDPELTEHDFTRVNLTELARRMIAEMDIEAHQKSIELKIIAEQDQVLSGNRQTRGAVAQRHDSPGTAGERDWFAGGSEIPRIRIAVTILYLELIACCFIPGMSTLKTFKRV